MKIQITTPIWLSVKSETRQELAKIFHISPSTCTNVVDGRVMCDGFANEDLAYITLEKLQEFTGCKSDELLTQFECAVKKIENPESLTYVQDVSLPKVEVVTESTPSIKEIIKITNTTNEKTKQNKRTNSRGNKKDTKTK